MITYVTKWNRWNDEAIHVVDQLDWHNNPPSKFFAAWEREIYARVWQWRLQLCGLLGDRQNSFRMLGRDAVTKDLERAAVQAEKFSR